MPSIGSNIFNLTSRAAFLLAVVAILIEILSTDFENEEAGHEQGYPHLQFRSPSGMSSTSFQEDASTIQDKLLVGYQGWFTCGGDGPDIEPGHHGWRHWIDRPLRDGGRITFEMWPSTKEYDDDELYALEGLTIQDRASPTGTRPAKVFSSRNPKTVRRHFSWMREYEISGAFLQRFLGEIRGGLTAFRDEVASRVKESAEAEGRVWAIMYDVSGVKGSDVEGWLQHDWHHISPMYLRERGAPVIGIWGMGMSNDEHDPTSLVRLMQWIKAATPGGAYIFAGTPSHWRTRDGDCDPRPEFDRLWAEVDAISPWYVGRFGNNQDADHFRTRMRDDKALIHQQDSAMGRTIPRDYAPVVFPGFSWQNLHAGPFNEIPRAGGQFLWHQLYNARAEGSRIIYGAMFDEYDEATALMPVEASHVNTPLEIPFMALDADGQSLPEDWYMRICAMASRSLKSHAPLSPAFPRDALLAYQPQDRQDSRSSRTAGSFRASFGTPFAASAGYPNPPLPPRTSKTPHNDPAFDYTGPPLPPRSRGPNEQIALPTNLTSPDVADHPAEASRRRLPPLPYDPEKVKMQPPPRRAMPSAVEMASAESTTGSSSKSFITDHAEAVRAKVLTESRKEDAREMYSSVRNLINSKMGSKGASPSTYATDNQGNYKTSAMSSAEATKAAKIEEKNARKQKSREDMLVKGALMAGNMGVKYADGVWRKAKWGIEQSEKRAK